MKETCYTLLEDLMRSGLEDLWETKEALLTPKGPCRYMVYTQGPKGFPYTHFWAQVYTIQLHGPFGLVGFVEKICRG